MKTLIKLASQRTTLPILNAIKVHKNMAYATDMEMVICEPIEGLKDGMYHGKGFEAVKVRFDGTLDDFPQLIEPQVYIGTADIMIADLEFVAQYMSTEASRYYLNGVCFNGADMVTTDGHRLGKVNYGSAFPHHPEYNSGVIMPAGAVKAIISLAKEFKVKSIALAFWHNRLVAKVGNATIYTKMVDGTYPDYSRVIPANVEHKTTFNQAEFKAREKEIRALAKLDKQKFIKLRLGKQCTTTFDEIPNISFDVSCKFLTETGFSLDYLLSMQSGECGWNDLHSPIVITNGNRLNLCMPCRV